MEARDSVTGWAQLTRSAMQTGPFVTLITNSPKVGLLSLILGIPKWSLCWKGLLVESRG